MVLTNKRIKIPESICFDEIEIKCVNEFKLWGITIDSKLSFNTHVSNLGRIINSRLFSIKRLFYLYNLHNCTDYNELNEYLQGQFNIPAFQHRIIQRLTFFSFKMFNFTSAPKILKEDIVYNLA